MLDFSAKAINLWAQIFCGMCVLMMLAGAMFAIYRWSYLKRATTTKATITNLIERENDDGDTLFAPEYVFTDQNNNSIKITSSTASFPPPGKIGDKIEVLYDPDNPQHSIQNDFFSIWGLPVILAVLSTFYFFIFAAVVYFTGRHLKRKEEQNIPGTSTSIHHTPQEISPPV